MAILQLKQGLVYDKCIFLSLNLLTGCPRYNLPEHGKASGNDEEFVGVGHQILVGCNLPYLTTLVNPNIYWILKCKSNGNWGWTYTCFTSI